MSKMIALGMYNESDIWFKAAKDIGYKLYVVCPNFPEHPLYEKMKPFVHEFVDLDYSDLDSLSRFCTDRAIDASLCLPCPNSTLMAQARLNTRLNFQGLQAKTADMCCDKLKFHSILEKFDFPRPSCTLPATSENANAFNFPFIVKPSFGAGGIEVSKINNSDDLEMFFKNIENQKMDRMFDNFIFQSFVQARYHIGFNCVVQNKKLIVLAHNSRDLKNEKWLPFFTENIFPSDDIDFISPGNIKILQSLIETIELDNWPLKIEAFADENKRLSSIIELNLRPGGTRSPMAFSKILGFDYAAEQVKLSSPSQDAHFKPHNSPEFKYLMIKNLSFPSGTVSKIKWFKPRNQIISFLSNIKPGTFIPPHWDVTVAQTCGELILVGNSPNELRQHCKEIESEIEIEYS